MPWEREIYLDMLVTWIKDENARQHGQKWVKDNGRRRKKRIPEDSTIDMYPKKKNRCI